MRPDDFVILVTDMGDHTLTERIHLTPEEKSWFQRLRALLIGESKQQVVAE